MKRTVYLIMYLRFHDEANIYSYPFRCYENYEDALEFLKSHSNDSYNKFFTIQIVDFY